MKCACLLMLLALSCGPPTPPPARPEAHLPDDTPSCGGACQHLRDLGCEEGKPLEDGTTCEKFCEDTQDSGHALRPSCVLSITTCAELGSKCGG